MSKTFLFLYGSMKSGTTWLSKNLESSPQYWNGGIKEWRFWPQYFNPHDGVHVADHHSVTGRPSQVFRSHARLNPDEFIRSVTNKCVSESRLRVLGDLTPSIGLQPQELLSLRSLMAHAGLQCKGLFLMRDPVSRTESELRMKIKNNRPGFHLETANLKHSIPAQLDEIIRKQIMSLVAKSRYEISLEICDSISTEIPYKTVFAENLFSQVTMDEVCKFIGIDTIKIDARVYNVGRKLPISEDSRRFIASKLRGTYELLAQREGYDVLPNQWRQSMELLD